MFNLSVTQISLSLHSLSPLFNLPQHQGRSTFMLSCSSLGRSFECAVFSQSYHLSSFVSLSSFSSLSSDSSMSPLSSLSSFSSDSSHSPLSSLSSFSSHSALSTSEESHSIHLKDTVFYDIIGGGIRLEGEQMRVIYSIHTTQINVKERDLFVDGCRFSGITGYALYASGTSTDATVKKTHFIQCEMGLLLSTRKAKIERCCFIENYKQHTGGFNLSPSLEGSSEYTNTFKCSPFEGLTGDDTSVAIYRTHSVKYANSTYNHAFDSSHIMFYTLQDECTASFHNTMHGKGQRGIECHEFNGGSLHLNHFNIINHTASIGALTCFTENLVVTEGCVFMSTGTAITILISATFSNVFVDQSIDYNGVIANAVFTFISFGFRSDNFCGLTEVFSVAMPNFSLDSQLLSLFVFPFFL